MLRPATPLTVLLLAAFVLLLLSVISTPIIKTIPLAQSSGVDFGVFGFCQGSACSKIGVGYDPTSLSVFTDQSFDLPTNTRSTLFHILIIHPIAAGFTLIMLVLAATAHLHSPSHSPRYLLGVFIMSIITLLLSLLAFLVDVLLFVPHMAWGSYIVLAATILIFASGIVACAMRRTLVSRKARKRRIEENAEMNGENFYNRQNAGAVPPMSFATAPLVNGSAGADKLPSFATFEEPKKDASERTSDERVPLTGRPPSERSPEAGPTQPNGGVGGEERYGGPSTMGDGSVNNGRFNGPPRRDQYGNIIPPQASYGRGGMRGDPRDRNGYPPPQGYRGRGGGPPGGYRGRGGPGYFPNGRGNYGPNGRGGYGGPSRGPGYDNGMMGPMAAGAVGGAMMRGGRGPPPGYTNGYGAPPPGRSYSRDRPPGGSYDSYGQSEQYNTPTNTSGYAPSNEVPPAGGYMAYNPDNDRDDGLPRAESPPPLSTIDPARLGGQVSEIDGGTGNPPVDQHGFTNEYNHVRDSDSDVAGMVGLQQQRTELGSHETVTDDARYGGEDQYVPIRQAWNQPTLPNVAAAEVAHGSPTSPVHRRQTSASDHYYEDVPPEFAEAPPVEIPPPQTPTHSPVHHPSTGSLPQDPNTYLHPSTSNPHLLALDGLHPTPSYDNLSQPAGSRSPAESDRSNFTSVSQRGVNPRWNPGPGMQPQRRPVPNAAAQRNEMLLNSNPDFELPGAGPRSMRKGVGTGGAIPLPMAATRSFSPPNASAVGMVPRSAYDGGVDR